MMMKKRGRTGRARRRFGYLMVAPAFLTLFIMTIYPFLYVVYVSFHKWSIVPTIPRVFIGLKQYSNMFHDTSFHRTLWVTFVYTFGVVAVEMLVGFWIAFLVSTSRNRWLRIAFIMPAVVAPVVVGLTWRFLFSYDLGPINFFVSSLGLERINWLGQPNTALISVMMVDIWQWTPFAMLIFLAGLESLPLEPYEAARVDGAHSWHILRYITLPQLTPIIAIILMFRTLDAFKTFDIIYMVTGGGPGNATEVLSYKIWHKAFFQNQLGYAAALSVLTLILATIMMKIFSSLLSRARTNTA
ncbi:ABC transporter permease subunit [candidate division KSB3 bacterium]|uniref:ABC transporter permease subunit n=1 Tax=candidate division KSB3 bacterium TaxID=2044937 RepID=A0A9D5Q835_9BACT|nr:ABC transporter permease subunit [candidate division KSB3 bacterium]MBD3327524.1 ABC transporter permease subunit [candidate division KSB3 bacterium]